MRNLQSPICNLQLNQRTLLLETDDFGLTTPTPKVAAA